MGSLVLPVGYGADRIDLHDHTTITLNLVASTRIEDESWQCHCCHYFAFQNHVIMKNTFETYTIKLTVYTCFHTTNRYLSF